MAGLDAYVALLLAEAEQQNLISTSTIPTLWSRHILDSLQLLELAPPQGLWIDIGTGAGLPGIPIALASDRPVALVEPRARRVAFLDRVIETLSLRSRVQLCAMKIERCALPPAAVISARAVAPLADLFAIAAHLADNDTVWLLPKGRNAAAELAVARASWHGEFELVPSRTDSEAAIVVARHVRRRKHG